MRSAQQVAKRAIVMTTLAFRSSLEVTDHPRSIELTERLLGWLERHQLDAALEPTEREILEAPKATLIRSQMTDATLASEGAVLLAWAIGHGNPLPAPEPADSRPLVQTLRILHDDVGRIVDGAVLRPLSEIEFCCVEILLTLCELRVRRLSDASAKSLLRNLEMGRIAELGLLASDASCRRVQEFLDSLSADENRSIAGIQFVRSIAVCWLFGSRESYYSS